ncbi:ABC transporter substrate-binding protein [Paenibacillus sp. NFR01]|uniref:ABC transporter substrate-binding protein n=1 Tax=Paenibacillus sp. NFR01 TaxID=1566279 RepID=UPI0008B6E65D|nr:extracellular solute-binding protein [Paenibacillus sp. NFR01]SEU26285.1 multiple sugar transport system substrate-binding protein [Paenibacillus sp. NFR01]
MKKTSIWLTSLCLLFSITACGNNNNGGNNAAATDAPASTEQAAASEQPAGKEKIKFYTFKASKPEEPMYQAVQAYNESQDKVEVEYVSLVQNSDSTDFMKKLDILVASGEVVDVFMTGNEEELLERASRGVVEPLNPFFDKEGVKSEDEYNKVIKLDGNIYGLLNSSTQWFTVFNREHLDKAGLQLPEMGWTWDDFRGYAKKLTMDGHYGTYFHTWGEYPNIIAYTERPNPQLDADLNPIFDDPSFKYFFELRRAMEQEDKSVEPYADVLASNYHVLQQFFAGNASMLVVPSYAVRAGLNLEKFPHEFQMVYAPVPRSVDSTELGMTNISGGGLAIGAKSEHKDAAYDFIRWMTKESAKFTKEIPAYKGVDGKALINEFFKDNQDLIDTESLANTLFDPRNQMPDTFSVPYGSELKTIVENGFSSYMLDNRSFDDVKAEMTDEVKKVVEANK